MDFNAAIFDLDGTILDSMDVWEHIDIQFLKKRNLPVPENYVTEICARSFEEAAQYTIDLFGYFQCLSLLKAIDDNWIEQVDYLQQLQQAIGSQTASQKNPIVEYYQEAFAGFETMKKQIKKDMVRNLLLSQVLVSEDGNIVTYFPQEREKYDK